MDDEARRRELVRLVELEIEGMRALVSSVLSTGNTVRVAGIAVWSAAMGGAIINDEPLLALLGIVALSGFAIVDAYHGHLYANVLAELIRNERIVGRYYELCGRYAGDARRTEALDRLLTSRSFGIHTKLRRRSTSASRLLIVLRIQHVRDARPQIIFRRLYPTLLLLGVVVGALTLCT
jgi:hypothetical protein